MPLQLKLGLTSSNGHHANGTHNGEVRRLEIGDKEVAKNPRDSRRKDKLITGRHILIDIYKEKYEMKGKFITIFRNLSPFAKPEQGQF